MINIFFRNLVKIAIVKINEEIAGNLVRKCYLCNRIVTLNEILMENELKNQMENYDLDNILDEFFLSREERLEINSLEDKATVLLWGYIEDSNVVGILTKKEFDLFWTYHYIDPNLYFDYGVISKNTCTKCLLSFILKKYIELKNEINKILLKLKGIVEDDF